MKKLIVALILITAFANLSMANYLENLDGNTWRKWNREWKLMFIAGFIEGGNYVILDTGSLVTENRKVNSEEPSILSSFYNRDKTSFEINEVHIIVNSYNEAKRMQLSKYAILNISSTQLADGVDVLYDDLRNRSIKLSDAIYVVKKQVQGTPPENIERILLFLRGDKKDTDNLIIKDEKGKLINIMDFGSVPLAVEIKKAYPLGIQKPGL